MLDQGRCGSFNDRVSIIDRRLRLVLFLWMVLRLQPASANAVVARQNYTGAHSIFDQSLNAGSTGLAIDWRQASDRRASFPYGTPMVGNFARRDASGFPYPQRYIRYTHDPNCQKPFHRYYYTNEYRKYDTRSIQTPRLSTPFAQATGDQCDLPQIIGTGPYRIPRWYFNVNTRRCELFYYSGCCGNGNNFPTYEACQQLCEVDPCSQTRDPGVGALQVPRYHFNRGTKLCEPFTYFGSGGNRNNFASATDCRKRCPETPNPCAYGEPIRQAGRFLPCGFGNTITNACPMHFFCHVGSSIATTVCCPKPINAPEKCQQPLRIGIGFESLVRWHFEPTSQDCHQIDYKGLQGNENNFLSKTDCENTCYTNPCSMGQPFRTTVGATAMQCNFMNGQPSCPSGYYCHIGADTKTSVCCPSAGEQCRQSLNVGEGSANLPRWFYDSTESECRPFNYSGLKGNENNFPTRNDCEKACRVFFNPCPHGQPYQTSDKRSVQCRSSEDCLTGYWCHVGDAPEHTVCCPGAHSNPCLGPPSVGIGTGNVSRWFYDLRTYKCLPFTYAGAGGTQNNFLTQEDCIKACPEFLNPCPVGEPVMEPGPGGFVVPLSCNPNSLQGVCPANNWCHVGDSDKTTMCCPMTSGKDFCFLPLSVGTGVSQLRRWYYNPQTLSCQTFSYSGLRGNENNFVTKEACESKCPVYQSPCLSEPTKTGADARPKSCPQTYDTSTNPCGPGFYCHIGISQETTVCCPSLGSICSLPLITGIGTAAMTRYYFNKDTRQCLPFRYQGTRGNDNNFLTEAACEAQCPVLKNPCPEVLNEIGKQTSATSCSSTKTCSTGYWCHIGDSPETTVCCKLSTAIENRTLGKCSATMSVGQGRSALNRWYYNADMQQCQQFVYNGLYGNSNNFETKEQCEQNCPVYNNVCANGQPFLVANKPKLCGKTSNPCPMNYWCHVGDSEKTTMCCPTEVKNPCEVPYTSGAGSGQLARWYFNPATRTCQQFHYRGIRGNQNNFLSENECATMCPVFENPCAVGEPMTDSNGRPLQCNSRDVTVNNGCPPNYWCHFGPGPESTLCCPGRQHQCLLPVSQGNGSAALIRWYFDSADRSCKQFTYRGKQGNANNFLSLESCIGACPVFVDPCPSIAQSPTLRYRQEKSPPIIYCSISVNEKDQKEKNFTCPTNHWCHVGADNASTVCCPRGGAATCEQPQQRGLGQLAVSRYYFDSTARQCFQFTYSGLGGNENNFLTLSQCERECPVYTNPCRRGEPYMGYASRPMHCNPAQPCPPNYWCHCGATPETTVCCPSETVDPCQLSMEPGLGGATLPRWYYSSVNRQCVQFSYQGMRGNQNNFLTRQDCERTCRTNPCAGGEPVADVAGGFLQCTTSTKCPEGHFCHFGENAQNTVCCPGASSNVCDLPLVIGFGSANLIRFYYNAALRTCAQFSYKGAGGNQNNFLTLIECRSSCPGVPNPCRSGEPPRDNLGGYLKCGMTIGGSPACPEGYWCHLGVDASTTVCCPGAQNPCVLPVAEGNGQADVLRWYFNAQTRQCLQFRYKGLLGNQNSFISEQECSRACPVLVNPCAMGQMLSIAGGQPMYCTASSYRSCPPGAWCHYGADRETTVCCPNAIPDQNICSLPLSQGRGEASLSRWYFNSASRQCTTFTYTGLAGNQNNFLTKEECLARCPEFENPCQPPNTPFMGPDSRPASCTFGIGCNPAYFCHLGYSPQTTVCCPGALEEACSGMPPVEGQGDYSLPRFYFDAGSRTCRRFQYRGTRGNANNFQTLEDCEKTCSVVKNPCTQPLPSSTPVFCSTASPICPTGQWCHIGDSRDTTLCCAGATDNPCIHPMTPGTGSAQLPRFYFDPSSGQCVQFLYRGSQGNQNNFQSFDECEEKCRPFNNPCPNGEPLMTPGPAPFNQPQTCNALTTASSCPSGYWCHVGATLDMTLCCPGAGDACTLPVAPGVGNGSVPRFYYDQSSRQCVQFSYAGMKGNQNNFPSLEACRLACREFRNPCIGQPAVTPTGQVVFCSSTNKDSCPVNYWCHVGATAETTLCCPGATNPCSVPLSPGTGSDNIERWYYNSDTRTCVNMVYNGLGGNQNNFLSRTECEGTCPEFVNPCIGGPPAVGRASAPLQCSPTVTRDGMASACPSSFWCHIGHKSENTVCCPGAVDKPCLLPLLIGDGEQQLKRWYFDALSSHCQPFEYSGSGGNQNNFLSKMDCQRACPEFTNPCIGEPERAEGGKPKTCFSNSPQPCGFGYYCHLSAQMDGPNYCCPASGDACDMPKLDGEGELTVPRWYFNPTTNECSPFAYRGLKGNQNNFVTREDCIQHCSPDINPCMAGDQPLKENTRNFQCQPDRNTCPFGYYCHVGDTFRSTVCCPKRAEPCVQPPLAGNGVRARLSRWFYSPQEDTCLTFTYSGSGGNENNFLTKYDCERTCPGMRNLCPHGKPLVTQLRAQECGVDLPCPDTYVCHINTQQSQSICCSDPAHFCLLPRDAGVCSNVTTVYGYNRETETCVPFQYGGCGGNLNRFASLEVCTEVCCDKGFK